jgi:hypothetical protein
MTLITRAWDTRTPCEPDFERRWAELLSETPHANFSLDLRYVQHEARAGRHSVAVKVREGDRGGVVVWRAQRGGWVSGWPWRWQAAIAGADPADPRGGDAAAWQWLFRRARGAVSGRVVRFHAPHPPERGVRSVPAGVTVFHDIAHDDETLLGAMASSKRRMLKRGVAAGYQVHAPRSIEDMRAFAQIDYELRLRKGLHDAVPPPADPPPGESWREWELPWMWLTVATLDGRVEAGVGDGVLAGGVAEARAGASSELARRDGAFALLSFAEARLARDAGYRWINLGGATTFKREFTGRLGHPIGIHCWMGVGSPWSLGQHGEILWDEMRARAGSWARTNRLARLLRGAPR